MTIRLRLTLWYSGLLAATLIVFGCAIYFFVNMNTYGEIKNSLRQQSNSIQFYGKNFSNELKLGGVGGLYEPDLYLQIVNYREGYISLDTTMKQMGLEFPYPKASKNPDRGFEKARVSINGHSYMFLIYQRPLYLEDGSLVGLAQVGTFVGSEERFLAGVRSILIFSSLAVLLIAFTVGLFLARQVLQPIERVIRSTEKIQNGSDLSVRIPMEGPKDEIGRLVYTLNIMLARLEMAYNGLDESYRAQRRFVSDASHELRTPLTTIRGNIELLQRMWTKTMDPKAADGIVLALDAQRLEMSNEAMQDISAEAKRMSTLVNDLLALARADAGYVMEKVPLPMFPLVEEVARRAQLLPRTAEWRVGDLSVLSGATVIGNHEYLQQLLFIFIENAFKYTSEGYIELSAKRTDDQVGVIIRDTGIGMDPEEVPHIFDRFYRIDESRGKTVGTGLGLSIAKWIIDEHRGSIEVTTIEGEGSTFVIWLPLHFSEPDSSTIIEAEDREEH
ncbi:sensor histidine kinase [Paenibacillus gorillae]|uniref:sensor histidine kinase n=1 Tax=Paenibacillus gorillae TaxID=1243662 RepID=UPI0004AD276E|nr:HAMP domain-containing sensor histidine kinase [Paenibacillus gorillae]